MDQRELLIKEFKRALDSHDWYYHYSDDQEVWKKGAENEASLLKIAGDDQELMHLWQLKWKQMFNNK